MGTYRGLQVEGYWKPSPIFYLDRNLKDVGAGIKISHHDNRWSTTMLAPRKVLSSPVYAADCSTCLR